MTPRTVQQLFDLKGKHALVTGGSRGLGLQMARALGEAGAKLMLSSRKADDLQNAALQLQAEGIEADWIAADCANEADTRRLADETLARFGKVDILVNNAGAAWGAPFDEFPENGWDKVVDLNMKTPFFLTQVLAPALRAAASANGGARPAKVINIASIDGVSVNPMETYSYAASKAGLIHLTRRMALRLAPENIMVSAIAPGAFASEMNRDARDHADAVAQRIPSRRIGSTEDMAGAAIFLASRAGDYVVGSTLIVDGGVTHARS